MPARLTVPNVQHITQPRKLCWATCILMAREVILNKQNPDVTPEKINEAMIYDSTAHGARPHVIKAACERWGMACNIQYSVLSFEAIRVQIEANQPPIIGIDWADGGGHAIVLSGYEMRGPTRWVVIDDPGKATTETVPYRWLEEGLREQDGTTHSWSESYLLSLRVVNV